MKYNIVTFKTETPQTVASVVVEESDIAWGVRCEGGCGRMIGVTKRYWYPVDFNDLNGGYVQVDKTAPGAIRCVSCGPFSRVYR